MRTYAELTKWNASSRDQVVLILKVGLDLLLVISEADLGAGWEGNIWL